MIGQKVDVEQGVERDNLTERRLGWEVGTYKQRKFPKALRSRHPNSTVGRTIRCFRKVNTFVIIEKAKRSSKLF